MRDRFGLVARAGGSTGAPAQGLPPAGAAAPLVLRPLETQRRPGAEVARAERGEGIEFADLRPFVFGDRVRRINWRASARRGELWVNEQHPERNTDVVIFLDSFAEARRGRRRDARPRRARGRDARRALPRAPRPRRARRVRRHPPLARARRPGSSSSTASSTRCSTTEIALSYAWKDVDVVPRADAAAAGARHRAHPAARRALGRRARSTSAAGLRPRRHRALARAVRRAGPRPSPTLAATGSGGCSAPAPRPLRAARGGRRRRSGRRRTVEERWRR